MKLRDLYEEYELKKGEDRQGDSRLPNHIYLENDKLQIILYDKAVLIELFSSNMPYDKMKEVYDSLNYKPKKVVGSDDIIQFLSDNKEQLYDIPKNEKNKKQIEDVLMEYNYYGYSGWKLFDNVFRSLDSYTFEYMTIETKYSNINEINGDYEIPMYEDIHVWHDGYGGYEAKKYDKILTIEGWEDGKDEETYNSFNKDYTFKNVEELKIKGWYRLK